MELVKNIILTKKKLKNRSFLNFHLLLGLFLSLFISLYIFSESFFTLFKNEIPLSGDGAFTGYQLELLKNNSFTSILTQNLSSNHFGWPFDSNFGYYATGNLLELVLIKCIFLFNNSFTPSNIIHIISILKALLIFCSSFWCFRKLKLNNNFALIGGIVFTFSSYNLVRSEGHFWLGLTWVIPIGIYCLVISSYFLLSNEKSNPRNLFGSIFFLGLLSGLSTLYYAFFFLYLSGILILLFTLKVISEYVFAKKNHSFLRVKSSFKDAYVLIIFVFSVLMGLAIQLIPAIINRMRNISLASSSARGSYTELFLYGGTLDSMFYDFNRFIVRALLNRPDIQNYLSSRNSWEASQLGALSGLTIYILIVTLLLSLFRFRISGLNTIVRSRLLTSLFLLLITSFLLYFPTYFSFTYFSIISQIRAFGRFSIVITFLCILILLFVLDKTRVTNRTKAIALTFILIIGLIDAYAYKLARPTSYSVDQIANKIKYQRNVTIKNMQGMFPLDCAIALIPLQPFPEFDHPGDNNIDYAQFDLLLNGNSQFKWNVGNFKNTVENRLYENLYSQAPNFLRTDLIFLLNYMKAAKFCGAVLDRTLMTSNENYDFESLKKSKFYKTNKCITDLGGESFKNSSRYYAFDFQKVNCNIPDYDLGAKWYELNSKNIFSWKNETPFGSKYMHGLQYFKPTDEIDLRILPRENSNSAEIRVYVESEKYLDKISLCIKIDYRNEKCSSILKNPKNYYPLLLKERFEKNKVYSMSIKLNNYEYGLNNWAVYPVSS